jgi:UMP-CMP kinase
MDNTSGKPEVVFVLGGPGSGKGTQCKKLTEVHNFVHLSAGDLLRAERAKESENAELINDYIEKGKIVPVKITCELIKVAMEENGWDKSRFLVDGFPRNKENLEGWQEVSIRSLSLPIWIPLHIFSRFFLIVIFRS